MLSAAARTLSHIKVHKLGRTPVLVAALSKAAEYQDWQICGLRLLRPRSICRYSSSSRIFPVLFSRRQQPPYHSSLTSAGTRATSTMADHRTITAQAQKDIVNEKKPPVVCVFCGAWAGKKPEHMQAARELAAELHSGGYHLVYGGGNRGLMGEIARALVELAGPEVVHGIRPRVMAKYEANGQHGATYGLTTEVADMHSRKKLMVDLVLAGGAGSGFVGLSGGYGTLDELMEVTTWNQLGIHSRAVVLFNVAGYWDGVIAWANSAAVEGFVVPGNRAILVDHSSAEAVVRALREYKVSESRYDLDWSKA